MTVKSTEMSFKIMEPVAVADGISIVKEANAFPGIDKKAERSYSEHPQYPNIGMEETEC